MKLKVLGSGSSGNLYILESSTGERLVLDCGVSFKEFRKVIKNKYSSVAGVFITHEHFDHSKYWKQYFDKGIKVYMTEGTAKALGAESHQYYTFKKDWWNENKGFSVFPVDIDHDAAEPVNFVVNHKEMGQLIYVTDTASIPIPATNPNHWLIEANHDVESLSYLAQKNAFLANRIVENHMSIDTCIDVLKETESYKCKTITLCHLSSTNSNAELFKSKVVNAINVVPNIAEKGLEVQL